MSDAPADAVSTRDDRVLPFVRVLSAAIVPFLLLAFVVLYVFPGEVARLFAWPIKSSMTSMMLGSAYLGGVYFFARVVRLRQGWHTVRAGLSAVALFATLLGVATALHWDVFSHERPAFWLWSALYFTTPALVVGGWLANERHLAPIDHRQPMFGPFTAVIVALVGGLALIQGVLLYTAPALLTPLWPWPLTPLTARVVGATFCLGCAGLVTLRDRRWSSLRVMLQVATIMIVLILVGAVRAWSEFRFDRPLTWLLLGGLLAVLIGSGYLQWTCNSVVRRRR